MRLWVLLDSGNNYTFFGFAVTTILLSLTTWLAVVVNIQIIAVRISFGLDPKTGMDSGPTNPNNKFVKRERKS